MDEPPYGTYRVVRGIDPETRQKIADLYRTREFPLKFSVIVGEIIHDLRSALDHAAYQLVKASGQKPTRPTG